MESIDDVVRREARKVFAANFDLAKRVSVDYECEQLLNNAELKSEQDASIPVLGTENGL